MGVKRLPKTAEFVAIDEIGNAVLIVEYTEMIGDETLDGPGEVPGITHYITAADQVVYAHGDGTFHIVGTGVVLRRPE